MTEELKAEVLRLGISRLCHFTPSRKLANILAGETGILSSKRLAEIERDIFDPTDLERWDGYPGHICCTIEYPNAWYFRKAKQKDIIFRDWVILYISPHYLWAEGTLFSPRNAAAQKGALLGKGLPAFKRLYAQTSGGQNCPPRGPNHLLCSPTDDQAEVLVTDRIALRDIMAIVVSSEAQAALETRRLKQMQIDPGGLKFLIAPTLYDAYTLGREIRAGRRPAETAWEAT